MGVLNIRVENQGEWLTLRRRLDALGYHTLHGVPARGVRTLGELAYPLVVSLDAQCAKGKGRSFVWAPPKKKEQTLSVAEIRPILDRACPWWPRLWWKVRGL